MEVGQGAEQEALPEVELPGPGVGPGRPLSSWLRKQLVLQAVQQADLDQLGVPEGQWSTRVEIMGTV